MRKAEDDDQAKPIQGKGFEHEEKLFTTPKESAASWVEIDPNLPLEKKLEATRAAIQDGAEVIYQATLQHGNLLGHADFLLRSTRAQPGAMAI